MKMIGRDDNDDRLVTLFSDEKFKKKCWKKFKRKLIKKQTLV